MTTNQYPTLSTAFLAVLLAMSLTGCGNDEPSDTSQNEDSGTHPAVQAALLTAEPQGAVSVLEARKNPSPGAAITVVGRIAGALDPFTEGYAILVLADDSLETCDRIPEDECETPWDACCVPQETIKASRLSVQVVGEDGAPVSQTLKGAGGLTELDTIVVTGKVAEGSNTENLIVNATGVFRKTT